MSTTHRIALLGFSAFERQTLASYFRLASTREPHYEQVQLLPDADLIVADADHAPSVKLVVAVERLPETVFVGARAPEGAIAWLTRPIDPMRVLRELDAMAARRVSPQAPAIQAPAVRAHAAANGVALAEAQRRRTVIQPVRLHRVPMPAGFEAEPADELDLTLPDLQAPPPVPAALPAPLALAASALPAVPAVPAVRAAASMPLAAAKAAAPRPAGAAPRGSASPPSTALLVDDSDVALRFLQKKLAPFGLITECASHSAAAIERLAERRYDFVFLDMELGDGSRLDGLGLCQHIKRDAATSNVVMVTAHHTELDRVRGALAGCDGFLGKPLDEEELSLYLARFGVKAAVNAGRAPS